MRRQQTWLRAALSVVVVSGLIVAVSACSGSGAAKPRAESPMLIDTPMPEEATVPLEDAVQHAVAATGSSGAIVGVWAPWSGSWVKAFGEASPGGEPVSTDMRFRAGKITRAMICDVLYQVAAEGTVNLDDSVTQWVSGVADMSKVTLVQLCNSTSGIGSYSNTLMPLWLQNPDRVWAPKELVSFGLGDVSEVPPGQVFRDSDSGYVLLGLALERATNRSAAELLDQYVFARLGMNETALPEPPPAPPATDAPVLNGYYTDNDAEGNPLCSEPTDVTRVSSSIGYTDSGVVSTITDLGRYARALAAGALVPPDASRFDPLKAVSANGPSWFRYGGGAYSAGQLVGQYGVAPGYLSAAYADPTSGLTVAVVLNDARTGAGMPTYLAWELAALASKIPVTVDGREPVAGLPWTPEQYRDAIEGHHLCPGQEEEPAA